MNVESINALLIEDSPGDARLITEVLRDAPEIVLHTVDKLSLGIEYLKARKIDVVLLDLGLPDSQGLGSLHAAHKVVPQTPIVVITGMDDEAIAKEAIRLGAQDYVIKSEMLTSLLARTLRLAVERKRAEKSLRESEAKYRQLYESMMDGFVRVDMQGRLVEWNSTYQAILGYSEEELRSLTYIQLTPETWHAFERKIIAEQVLSHGYSEVYEKEYRRKDGTIFPVELRTFLLRDAMRVPNGMWAIVRDITERRLLQRQLLQAQKMEGIGRLAGGIAHDFNNLLTVIIGYSEQLLDNSPSDYKGRSDLELIRDAGERATSLTSKLLAFSRKQILQSKVFNVNGLVTENSKLLRRMIGEDIELTNVLAPDLGFVKADVTQLEQVVFNLAVNSRDAMPKGGKLVFETANVDLDDSFVKNNIGSSPGKFVMMAISDTGAGMDAETKSHIFEPFFTTKEIGKGTGLGLATVYGIVKQSGGYISVDSEPGQGTIFRIYLPRVDESLDQEQRFEAIESGGSETILLVEDAEDVRFFAARCLTAKGYTVLVASDGLDALSIAERHAGTIDLLITDMVLPKGFNGRDIAEKLREFHPGIRVLFISGYFARLTDNTILDQNLKIFQKPFTAESLTKKVREVLRQKN